MTLLLDTHVLLWWLSDHPRLGPRTRSDIADPSVAVRVSAVSVWEVSIKRALGKLSAPEDLLAAVAADRLEELPFRASHAEAAGRLPRHHDDPFDRALVAQAATEDLTLVTADAAMQDYDVRLQDART